jgi:hypothetical protein
MNANWPMLRWALVVLVGLAGAAWSLSWAFGAQAADGGSALGLDAGQWRAALNPALAGVLLALVAWMARDPRPARLVVVAGAGLLLVGNLLAHGLVGRPTPIADGGVPMFVAGATVIVAAFGWMIGRGASGLTGRRWLGVSSGAATTVSVATMAVAAPAAASLVLVLLADALLRAEPGTTDVASATPVPGVRQPRVLSEAL